MGALEDLLATNYSDDNGYSIQVSCHGSCHLGAKAVDRVPPIDLEATVAVQHQSLDIQTPIKICGYYASQNFTLQSNQVFSRERCGDKVRKILDMINIPFSLDKKEFQWTGTTRYRTDHHQSYPNHNRPCINDYPTDNQPCSFKSLKNSEDSVAEFVELFQKIKGSVAQALRSVEKINVILHIQRLVFLPHDLFQEWIYWMENRRDEYVSLAWSRPVFEMRRRIAAGMTLDSLRVDGGGWSSSDICSICMNELSPEAEVISTEAEVIRMVCSHVFHRSCILKWLKFKESCPYCRATFTMTQPATYPPQKFVVFVS